MASQPTTQQPGQSQGQPTTQDTTDAILPTPKPLTDSWRRMLAGKPLDEPIIDPANPNLIVNRDR
ncbi:MAG: hypothetical protein HQL82_02205 [Magnetococcales bacterium]|nr:hypothetical protein [Magnetococcales bacterium]